MDWYANDKLVCEDSRSYIPTSDDADKYIAIIITPIRPGYRGQDCQEAYRFKAKVEKGLPENKTLKIRKEWLAKERSEEKGLRVLSYNILAEQNAFINPKQESSFQWIPKDLLIRSRRMPLILHEILAHEADIICLQEVDKICFSTILQPALEYYNYQGYYSVKQTHGNNEGCALFWSLSKFRKARSTSFKTHRISDLLGRYIEPLADSEWGNCTAAISNIFKRRPDLKDTVLTKLGR